MGDILKAPENVLHPRDYSAPSSSSDQSRPATNQILKLSQDQIYTADTQGSGTFGPSVWGGPSGMSASQSSAAAGTKQGNSYSVDLSSGQNSCWNGGSAKSGQ